LAAPSRQPAASLSLRPGLRRPLSPRTLRRRRSALSLARFPTPPQKTFPLRSAFYRRRLLFIANFLIGAVVLKGSDLVLGVGDRQQIAGRAPGVGKRVSVRICDRL